MRKIGFIILFLLTCFLSAYAEEGMLSIPSSIKEIGMEAFKGDESIQTLVIPKGVQILESAFDGCVNLRTLVVLDGADVDFESVFSDLSIENIYCSEGTEAHSYALSKGICIYPLKAFLPEGDYVYDVDESVVIIAGYQCTDFQANGRS